MRLRRPLAAAFAFVLGGCASMMISSAGAGLADSVGSAMRNQNDPEIVRDGAPAFLMMLDGFVEESPDDPELLAAAAELYASYGVVFVDQPERARKLTSRARAYGRRAVCASEPAACGIWGRPYEEYLSGLEAFDRKDVPAMYTLVVSSLAYIQAHSDDWKAVARLPEVTATLRRLQALDPDYRTADVEHYLGVLNTFRPPALGGDFEAGLAHFERAVELAGDRDLSIKVDFARYYARTLYERELHDGLLTEVLEADAEVPGYVLSNTLAQSEARALLESADDYF